MISLLIMPVAVSATQVPEKTLKTAFLYNFVSFVEWPKQSEVTRLCIYGKNTFGEAIEKIDGKNINGRRLQVLPLQALNTASECQILFISKSKASELANILEVVQQRNILTVTDAKGLAAKGIMIEMIRVRDRIGFEINLYQITLNGLTVSSKLLRLANKVHQEK